MVGGSQSGNLNENGIAKNSVEKLATEEEEVESLKDDLGPSSSVSIV